jgi:hypothetical protein
MKARAKHTRTIRKSTAESRESRKSNVFEVPNERVARRGSTGVLEGTRPARRGSSDFTNPQ